MALIDDIIERMKAGGSLGKKRPVPSNTEVYLTVTLQSCGSFVPHELLVDDEFDGRQRQRLESNEDCDKVEELLHLSMLSHCRHLGGDIANLESWCGQLDSDLLPAALARKAKLIAACGVDAEQAIDDGYRAYLGRNPQRVAQPNRLHECFLLGRTIANLESKPTLDVGPCAAAERRRDELVATLGVEGMTAYHVGYRSYAKELWDDSNLRMRTEAAAVERKATMSARTVRIPSPAKQRQATATT